MSPAQMSGLLLGVRQVRSLTSPDEPAGIVTRFGETINQTFETGATFLYAFDRLCLEGMTPAVDFTQAAALAVHVFVSDYSILTNSPGDLRIDFTSGANRWQGRVPYMFFLPDSRDGLEPCGSAGKRLYIYNAAI